MGAENKAAGGPRIRVSPNGPYLVAGDVPLAAADIVAGADGIADPLRRPVTGRPRAEGERTASDLPVGRSRAHAERLHAGTSRV